jgi:ABC-type multidrug transport system ATPase subunit/pSer/pThr/pTyr-binding forkhead associated (FHA) protein
MSNRNAKLTLYRDSKFDRDCWLNTSVVTIGRAPDNILCLSDDLSISRHHAQVAASTTGYLLTDVGSSDGTYVNGDRLQPFAPRPIREGDEIQMGKAFKMVFTLEEAAPAQPAMTALPIDKTQYIPLDALTNTEPTGSQGLQLRGRETLSIGRDAANDLVIDHPAVSRFHSQIKLNQGQYTLYDLGSTNGTFVNGQLIAGNHTLRIGDAIRIGSTQLIFNPDETLIRMNEEGNLRIDAMQLNKVVGKDLNLLNNISLSVQAREFVAIAGVSGGGKSTLLDALNGFRPATSGMVYVNGMDLYKNFNAYRTEIGYVPQKDIVHMELSVEEALLYAAKLRMSADATPAERHQRVEEVMADLNLTHRREVPIRSLSGGQLKRVSIGVELLTKPSLFFLDEATSGLDPGTESELMQLLRELADQGRTILLITHATDNVMLCNHVIFMARGGNLAFFGPPQEALEFFGVQRFNEIYRKVENELTPEEWQARYQKSPYYQKYVVSRQRSLNLEDPAHQNGGQRLRQAQPAAQVKRASHWHQFKVLSHRNLAILARDRISLLLMLAVAPFLGLMDFTAWPKSLFNLEKGNPSLTVSMIFTSILIAVMVGSLATMREIVKEIEIYRRERMIGLSIAPYVLSKVWVAVLLAIYQAAIFVLFKSLAIDLPRTPSFIFGMFITLFLATIGGMMMGLFGSAISPNQSVAPMIVLVLLIPQILFGGGVLPIETFGPPGQVLNRMSLTKWPFETLMTLTQFGTDVAKDKCWALPEAERDALKDAQKKDCTCMGRNVFKTCKFPGILESYDPVVETPEPKRPLSPEQPSSSSFAAQAAFQDELAQYQKDMDKWQDDYSDWKRKHDRAIEKAEGTIKGLKTKFGQSFNVNVTTHLTIFTCFIGILLAFTIGAQKVKDFL